MELGLTVRSDEDDSPKPHGDKLAVPAGRAAGHRRKVMLGERRAGRAVKPSSAEVADSDTRVCGLPKRSSTNSDQDGPHLIEAQLVLPPVIELGHSGLRRG